MNFDKPYWAALSALIVSQPLLGATFNKGFLRIIGATVGSAYAIALIAMTAQLSAVFLVLLACWVSICVFIAAQPNQRSAYVYILSGLTATVVGVIGVQSPDNAFIIATVRLSEEWIGILSCIVVHSVLFPVNAGRQLHTKINEYATSSLSLLNIAFDANNPSKEKSLLLLEKIIAELPATQDTLWAASYDTESVKLHMDNYRLFIAQWVGFNRLCYSLQECYCKARHSPIYLDLSDDFSALRKQVIDHLNLLKNNMVNAELCTHIIDDSLKEKITRDLKQYLLDNANNYLPKDIAITQNLIERLILAHDTLVNLANAWNTLQTQPRKKAFHLSQRKATSTSPWFSTVQLQKAATTFLVTILTGGLWFMTGWDFGSGCMLFAIVLSVLGALVPMPPTGFIIKAYLIALPFACLQLIWLLPQLVSYIGFCFAIGSVIMLFLSGTLNRSPFVCLFSCVLFIIMIMPNQAMHYDIGHSLNWFLTLAVSVFIIAVISCIVQPAYPEKMLAVQLIALLKQFSQELEQLSVSLCAQHTVTMTHNRERLLSGFLALVFWQNQINFSKHQSLDQADLSHVTRLLLKLSVCLAAISLSEADAMFIDEITPIRKRLIVISHQARDVIKDCAASLTTNDYPIQRHNLPELEQALFNEISQYIKQGLLFNNLKAFQQAESFTSRVNILGETVDELYMAFQKLDTRTLLAIRF